MSFLTIGRILGGFIMEVPKIPNNSLTEEIEELIELCQKLEPGYGGRAFSFNPPASEEEIADWERKNGISIPESYKDWLRFSNGSMICWDCFYSLERLIVGIKIEGNINNDLVIIGNVIGDGEFICFSRTTERIYWEDHGEITDFEDFKSVLNYIMDIM